MPPAVHPVDEMLPLPKLAALGSSTFAHDERSRRPQGRQGRRTDLTATTAGGRAKRATN